MSDAAQFERLYHKSEAHRFGFTLPEFSGMLAEAAYSWLDKTPAQRRKARDWLGMLKPLCVSPLILIPTVGSFQSANIDLARLGLPWVMILLTAFEKGFLWRFYLKKHQGAVLSGAIRSQVSV